MKYRITDKKTLTIMLIIGVVLMAAGASASYLLPEEAHTATHIAGFASGLGTYLAVMGGVLLLRRARLGEKRVKDAALMMTDERGLAVAYKAQSAAAVVAVFALAAVDICAMLRNDTFYMTMTSILLCAVALIKLIAWHFYNRTM